MESPELYDYALEDQLEAHGKAWYGEVCERCGHINPVGHLDHGDWLGLLGFIVPSLVIMFLLGAVMRPVIDQFLLPVVRMVLDS